MGIGAEIHRWGNSTWVGLLYYYFNGASFQTSELQMLIEFFDFGLGDRIKTSKITCLSTPSINFKLQDGDQHISMQQIGVVYFNFESILNMLFENQNMKLANDREYNGDTGAFGHPPSTFEDEGSKGESSENGGQTLTGETPERSTSGELGVEKKLGEVNMEDSSPPAPTPEPQLEDAYRHHGGDTPRTQALTRELRMFGDGMRSQMEEERKKKS
ncbi:hypothetical protein BJ138DRAFT_1097056 [Hygrophoropsis aurantiaca]|uniref:Uncharacterized protein n=1 Tax=Hygrophoropsis aurantiaca TaxID=72124 RepID=A0ACB8ATE2_9AGAM|nr:hypothetical protein BJ138DRAFT_1097056 [Hygrophoropsis aurantiaca]